MLPHLYDSQLIQTLINNAITSGSSLLSLPSGNYSFTSPLMISNARSLTIKGNITLVLFDPRTTASSYITITSSTNVTLSNIFIDCYPLPFTQGLVTSVATNSINVQIHTGYSTNATQFSAGSYLHVFNTSLSQYKQEASPVYGISGSSSISGGLSLSIYTVSYYNIQVGDTVSITQPSFICAIQQYNSVLTSLTNLTIYTSAGCGVLEGAGGGTVIDNVQIRRGSTPNGATQPRLMSTIRDGFHLQVNIC